jgi:hypothetical protein
MQDIEELRQKGQNGSRKTTCRERGKNIIFRRGGGINIVFGPKYRPLRVTMTPLKAHVFQASVLRILTTVIRIRLFTLIPDQDPTV